MSGEHGRPMSLAAAEGLVRTVACLLVVLVHVNMKLRPPSMTWWPFGGFGIPLFSLVVPAFMLLSGFAAARATSRRAVGAFGAFVWRKVRQLLPVFLFWNVVIVVVQARGLPNATGQTLLWLLTGAWQLYYLFALFSLLVLHRLLLQWEGPGLFWSAVTVSVLYYGTADAVLWTRGLDSLVFETHLNRLFLPWAAFFACGVALRRRPGLLEAIWQRRVLLVLWTAVAYAGYVHELCVEEATFAYNPLMQFLATGLTFQAGGLLLLVGLAAWWRESGRAPGARRTLEALAPSSYGVYVVHTTILMLLMWAYDGAEAPLPLDLEVPVMWAACCLGSFAFVRFAGRKTRLVPR